jgi:hypothetical protein
MSRRCVSGFLAGAALATSACSWSRFDDLEENAPVVLLSEPRGIGPGFGSAVAAGSTSSDARVLVAAARNQRGAAEYRIGFGHSPVVDAIDGGHCLQDCALASSIASLTEAATPTGVRSFCWATGASPIGVIARCGDGQPLPDYALPTPAGLELAPTDRLQLASDHGAPSSLAAATTATGGRAWFYPPLELSLVELAPPSPEAGFGAALAVALAASGRIYAVGAPEADRVWLFAASADGKSVASTGCVTGGAGFGRTLAAGDVDGVAGDELVVAANDHVEVLGAIDLLAQGGACVATESARLARLECVSTADVSGCANSGFGAALAVGDVDGDGNGEVFVGAPGMSVRGQSGAGAIEVFDLDLSGAKQPEWLAEAKFLSSARSGDALGSSLATVLQWPAAGGNPQHVLLAGAPGGDKAAIFYCFDLPSGKRGARCK